MQREQQNSLCIVGWRFGDVGKLIKKWHLSKRYLKEEALVFPRIMLLLHISINFFSSLKEPMPMQASQNINGIALLRFVPYWRITA